MLNKTQTVADATTFSMQDIETNTAGCSELTAHPVNEVHLKLYHRFFLSS